MRTISVVFCFFVFFYLTSGLFIHSYDFDVFSNEFDSKENNNYYDYKGVLNVHTTRSTGTGTPKEVIQAAVNADLDFMYITDLNQRPPREDMEGYYQHTMILPGGEYSYLDSRLLNINYKSNDHLSQNTDVQLSLSSTLDQSDWNKDEGTFIIAHPLKKNYKWMGEVPRGVNGIEVINLKSIWQNSWLHEKLNFFWTLLIYPFNPEFSFVRLLNLSEAELTLLDQMNKKQRTLAFAGTDAEARFNFFNSPIKFPSYETLFKIARNHVILKSELTGNFQSDRSKITNALSSGQFYLSYDIIANPTGFNVILNQNGKKVLMGSEIELQSNSELSITLPKGLKAPFNVYVFKDGQQFHRGKKDQINLKINQPGVYRVTVELKLKFPLPDGHKWIPWIISNPFFIR